MKKLFLSSLLILLLSGCYLLSESEPVDDGPVATNTAMPATATLAVTQSAVVLPTSTTVELTATLQPTLIPTVTPQPSTISTTEPIWVAAGNQITNPTEPIQTENVFQVAELARWGRGTIRAITYSADGRWLVVGSSTGAYIHDTENFGEPITYLATPAGVRAIDISLSGKLVAVALENDLIQVWDAQQAQLLYTLEHKIWKVKFSPDGQYLAIDSERGIELLQSKDGAFVRLYRDMITVDFSHDSQKIAVGDYDNVTVYDLPSGMVEAVYEPLATSDEDSVGSVFGNPQFGANGALLMLNLLINTGGLTGDIFVQGGERQLILTLPLVDHVAEAVSGQCDTPVFYGDPIGYIVAWELELSADQQTVGLLYKDSGFGEDKHYSSVRFYDLHSGRLKFQPVEEGIVDIALAPDGQTWAAALQDGRLEIRRISDGSVIQTADSYEAPIQELRVSPLGDVVAVEYLDEVKIRRIEDGVTIFRYSAAQTAFSPDGAMLALGYTDGRIEFRSSAEGTLLQTLEKHTDAITDLEFLPSGNELLSVGMDCGFYLWDLTANQLSVRSFENLLGNTPFDDMKPARIEDLMISPDGRLIFGRFQNGGSALWYADQPALQAYPEENGRFVVAAISPDQKQLAFAGTLSPTWLGELTPQFELWQYDEHLFTFAVAFSPDSSLLVTGSNDNSIIPSRNGALELWAADQKIVLYTLTPIALETTTVAFSPNGRLLFSTALDGVVRVWGIPPLQ